MALRVTLRAMMGRAFPIAPLVAVLGWISACGGSVFSSSDQDAGGSGDGSGNDAMEPVEAGIDVTTSDAPEDFMLNDGPRPQDAPEPRDALPPPPDAPSDVPVDVSPPPPPIDAGDVAPCLVNEDVLYLDGDPSDYIHPGVATITSAAWTPSSSPTGSTQPDTVSVHLVPTNSMQGLWWDADFSSKQLGQPLELRAYPGAQRLPFAMLGHPGLEVTGDGRGCNTITGSFIVYELQTDSSGTLHAFTASFIQYCEGGTAALRGCVHVQQ
jgi:hypothetical protein